MKKLVLNNRDVKNLVGKLCREVANSGWRPEAIVGMNRGGLILSVMISHWFDAKHVPLSVSLRDHEDCESNLWLAEWAYDGKNILVVDDINDTGATFNWIMKDWPSGCLPREEGWTKVWNGNVKFAVLVDNQASQCDVKMDFCGMEINKAEDEVWVDFPWEDWWTK